MRNYDFPAGFKDFVKFVNCTFGNETKFYNFFKYHKNVGISEEFWGETGIGSKF